MLVRFVRTQALYHGRGESSGLMATGFVSKTYYRSVERIARAHHEVNRGAWEGCELAGVAEEPLHGYRHRLIRSACRRHVYSSAPRAAIGEIACIKVEQWSATVLNMFTVAFALFGMTVIVSPSEGFEAHFDTSMCPCSSSRRKMFASGYSTTYPNRSSELPSGGSVVSAFVPASTITRFSVGALTTVVLIRSAQDSR